MKEKMAEWGQVANAAPAGPGGNLRELPESQLCHIFQFFHRNWILIFVRTFQ